jgi:peptide deformylase
MKILHYPHPFLLRRTHKAGKISGNLADISRKMLQLMRAANGIGLAANQVGLDLRMFVANLTGEPQDAIVMINPEIVESAGLYTTEEGCLSFPEIFGAIERHREVLVEYYDLAGKFRAIQATDILARVCQHEMDHLNGIIFVNRMSPDDRTVNSRRIKELESAFARSER